MLFGHNTDVKVGENVFHVQTEDRGGENALIDTTVYCRGQILHRRTSDYKDLLPLEGERENSLRKRIDDQHRNVAEEIRSGALKLEAPPVPVKLKSSGQKRAAAPAGVKAAAASELVVELVNAKNWLEGKRANLHVGVRKKQNEESLAGALVVARVEGAEAGEFSGETGADGRVHIAFDMPRLAGEESALVIEAYQGELRGQLKFYVKARPRVPTV